MISQFYSISLILVICLIFIFLGISHTRNDNNLKNYLVANRSVGTFSLTMSLVASSLGAWILFGPPSAATWGGIGAIIGYALGAAMPMIILLKLGVKLRTEFPSGNTFTEIIRLKFGKRLFKFILFLSCFYMFIFLIAEVTAVALLINYISGTDFWITALIIIFSSLIYTLYGGLRASIFTDNIQFVVLVLLLSISFIYMTFVNFEIFNFSYIKLNSPELISLKYVPNFTNGFIFFIAVATTNLFHQGNWQRVYAAKNNTTLKRSLILSFLCIVPIVFMMGFTGLIATSENELSNSDLAFFSLLLKQKNFLISITIVYLAICLTASSIDTLINAISSFIIVDGKKIIKTKQNPLKLSRIIIFFLAIIVFLVASKGLSILYLFLLADLFCCSAAASVFYGFYAKSLNEKKIIFSIIAGLIGGLLFFPAPDFSKSLLVGVIFPEDTFPLFFSESLLFLSFFIATFLPVLCWKIDLPRYMKIFLFK